MKADHKEFLEIVMALIVFAVIMILGWYGYLGTFMQEVIRGAFRYNWYYGILLTACLPKELLIADLIRATTSGKGLALVTQELQNRVRNPPPEAIMDAIKNGCLTVNQKELQVSKAFYGHLARYLPPHFIPTEKGGVLLTGSGIHQLLNAVRKVWRDYPLALVTQEFLTYLILLHPEKLRDGLNQSSSDSEITQIEVCWVCDRCGSVESKQFKAEDIDLEGLHRRVFPNRGVVYFGCIFCEKCLQKGKEC